MFETLPVYRPDASTQTEMLKRIGVRVATATGLPVASIVEVGTGQNPSYKIFVEGDIEPRFFVKIVARKGYPSFSALAECGALLRTAGIHTGDLTLYEDDELTVPYGFLVQPWIAGRPVADDVDNLDWLSDFARYVRRVHEIEAPAFGYLGDGPRYDSLIGYFEHMDEVIDHSFGDVFLSPFSIWQFQEVGLTSPNFLVRTFDRVSELAGAIAEKPRAVLIHGDMLPSNLIHTPDGPRIVDWDECRSSWWVYEIARTLFFMHDPNIPARFLAAYGEVATSVEDISVGVRLEHVRQHLRQMCIGAFNMEEFSPAQAQVGAVEQKVNRLLFED